MWLSSLGWPLGWNSVEHRGRCLCVCVFVAFVLFQCECSFLSTIRPAKWLRPHSLSTAPKRTKTAPRREKIYRAISATLTHTFADRSYLDRFTAALLQSIPFICCLCWCVSSGTLAKLSIRLRLRWHSARTKQRTSPVRGQAGFVFRTLSFARCLSAATYPDIRASNKYAQQTPRG